MEEKIINGYECMFIVSLADGEDAAKATVKKFTDLIEANAKEVVKCDVWGKKRLAYPIQDMNDGYYTVVDFKSEGAFIAELERLMNIDETVLRSMTVRFDVDAAAKVVVPAPEEPAEETVEAPVEEKAEEKVEAPVEEKTEEKTDAPVEG